jgi:type VI secretion system secreted protein Hcp
MAFDAYLKLDGIQGDATAKNHKNDIEILSYSWGISAAAQLGAPATVQNFVFTADVAGHSPQLVVNLLNGAAIKTGELTLVGGVGPQSVISMTFDNIKIDSYASGGAGDEAPRESVSFTFQKCDFAAGSHSVNFPILSKTG